MRQTFLFLVLIIALTIPTFGVRLRKGSAEKDELTALEEEYRQIVAYDSEDLETETGHKRGRRMAQGSVPIINLSLLLRGLNNTRSSLR